MEQPNYILKTVETSWKTVEPGTLQKFMKKALTIIIVLIILFSILFGENLLSSMSTGSVVLLFFLIVKTYFNTPDEEFTAEIEYWFYDDRFVIYRPKYTYTDSDVRREYKTFYYEDVEKAYYKVQRKLLCFDGTIHEEYYRYDAEGNLPEEPTEKRVSKHYFDHTCIRSVEDPIALVEEINKHLPVDIEILEDR